MCFPADGPSDPGLAADAAAKRRLHSQQSSGEPDSSGATTSARTATQEPPPLEKWGHLAHYIESGFTAGDNWPIHYRTIQELTLPPEAWPASWLSASPGKAIERAPTNRTHIPAASCGSDLQRHRTSLGARAEAGSGQLSRALSAGRRRPLDGRDESVFSELCECLPNHFRRPDVGRRRRSRNGVDEVMTWGYVTDWPAGTPRVLMTDCWLQNAGDAAIAIATKRMILRFAPSAAILHAAYGADSVGERYPELAIVPPLDSLRGTRWAEPDRETGVDGPALVSGADFVFSQGGGFLREGYQPWSRIDALVRATDLVGSVSLLGQTIGVFTTAFGRVALGELLRRSSAVLVRDTNSRASAIDLGADPARVHLGTDFSLEIVPSPILEPRGSSAPTVNEGVGVVLSDHVVPGESADRSEVASRLLAAVVDESGSAPVTVWSSSQGIPGDSEDDVVARAAVDRLPARSRSRVTVAPGHIDAYDLYRWSTAFPALVSMRFHPALLAAAYGIPSVLAMSDPKAAFFNGSPMQDRVVVGQDSRSAVRAARMALQPAQPDDGRSLLGPVLDRLRVNHQVVAGLLAGAR